MGIHLKAQRLYGLSSKRTGCMGSGECGVNGVGVWVRERERGRRERRERGERETRGYEPFSLQAPTHWAI